MARGGSTHHAKTPRGPTLCEDLQRPYTMRKLSGSRTPSENLQRPYTMRKLSPGEGARGGPTPCENPQRPYTMRKLSPWEARGGPSPCEKTPQALHHAKTLALGGPGKPYTMRKPPEALPQEARGGPTPCENPQRPYPRLPRRPEPHEAPQEATDPQEALGRPSQEAITSGGPPGGPRPSGGSRKALRGPGCHNTG